MLRTGMLHLVRVTRNLVGSGGGGGNALLLLLYQTRIRPKQFIRSYQIRPVYTGLVYTRLDSTRH